MVNSHEVNTPESEELTLATSIVGMLVYDFSQYSPMIFSRLKSEHLPHKLLRIIFEDAGKAFKDGVQNYDLFDVQDLLKKEGMSVEHRLEAAERLTEAPKVYDLGRKCDQLVDFYRKRALSDALSGAVMDLDSQPVTDVMSQVSDALTGLTRGTSTDVTVADYRPKVMALAEGGVGLRSRHPELNQCFDYKGLVVIAARPSDGKTSHAVNEADAWAEAGIPGGIFSLEMAGEDLLMRMAAAKIQIPFFKFLKGAASKEDKRRLNEVLQQMQDYPLYIHDGKKDIDELCAAMITEARNKNWRYAIVDYLQLIKASAADLRRSANEYVGHWCSSIKHTQKQLGIPVLLISQLSRAGNRNKEESPPPPTLEALRDSGQIEQDADSVVFLYKKPGIAASEFDRNRVWEMMMEIAKQRNGPLGIVEMMFDRPNTTYYTKSVYNELNSTPTQDKHLF